MASEPAIHQYIFAGPKPGLSAQAFQSYWVNFHAVDYAAKIPQIRRYLVATREKVEAPRQMPFFEGVAEIWLQNDEEQIASMQTNEFLHGAREDEPRWAAFWQTFVLDTESQVVKEAGGPRREFVNAYVLVKRKPNVELDAFAVALKKQASEAVANPAMRRCTVGLARKGLYGFGEPRFDAIEVWSFDTPAEAGGALAGVKDWEFADERYVFGLVAREHWVIPSAIR
jgi:EthD domain-containing protein